MTDEHDNGASLRDRAASLRPQPPAASSQSGIPSAGDRLYAVPADRRWSEPCWVVVAKGGRKWLTLHHENGYEWGRCEKTTLRVDAGGYTPRHRLYRSISEYEELTARTAAWKEFQGFMSRQWVAPEHLSRADIERLSAIAQGTSAFGQDAERLEAKPAGPVGETDAPETGIPVTDLHPSRTRAVSKDTP